MKFISLILMIFPLALQASIFQGPASTALGGAGSAGVQVLEAAHLNPATLGHAQGYHMGFMYGSGSERPTELAPTSNQIGMGVVLTDASEDVLVPASLSYTKGNLYLGGVEFEENEILVGFGYRLINVLSFGMSAKRIARNQAREKELVEHNGSIGFLLTPYKSFGFSLVFQDVLNTSVIPMSPITTLGAFWMFEDIARFYGDWSQPQKSNPQRKDILALGVESILPGSGISFRTGGRWDQVDSKRFGAAGLGWDGPNLSLDYAYEKNVDSDEFRHLVDMRVQF